MTGARYEEIPSASDLATVALVHHVVTGERYLGDGTGMELDVTLSLCAESVKYGRADVVVGNHSPLVAGTVGGPGPSGGLLFSYNSGGAFHSNGGAGVRIGIAGVRLFSGHRKLEP